MNLHHCFLCSCLIVYFYVAICDEISLVRAVNSDQSATWRARVTNGRYKSFIQRAPRIAGEILPPLYGAYRSAELPVQFDGRDAFPGCIHGVMNQGDCGSCWAFAASEVLSDRFCIASSGAFNTVLSPQDLLSCEKENLGCTMGSPPGYAWEYLQRTGISTFDCTPYVSGNGHTPKCDASCTNTTVPKVVYKASNYSHVGDFLDASKHVAEIMSAVIRGPVDATFNVYSDFMSYSSGVYKHLHGGYEGLHSVKVIGYGTEEGQDYWLVQNSWGPDWGFENGHFKIARGVDECSFEREVYTGWPAL